MSEFTRKQIHERADVSNRMDEMMGGVWAETADGKAYFGKRAEAMLHKLVRDSNGLREKVAKLQATIDRLMLEYCPDEMTEEQCKTWAKHQVPATDGHMNELQEALADKPEPGEESE